MELPKGIPQSALQDWSLPNRGERNQRRLEHSLLPKGIKGPGTAAAESKRVSRSIASTFVLSSGEMHSWVSENHQSSWLVTIDPSGPFMDEVLADV